MLRFYGNPPYRAALLHGGPGALGDMGDCACELHRRTGLSVAEPIQSQLSIEALIEELHAQLQSVSRSPLPLIGHSWGALLAVLYACRYPEQADKLILVGCPPLLPSYVPEIAQNRLSRMTEPERQEAERLEASLACVGGEEKDAVLKRLGALMDAASNSCYEEPADPPGLGTDGTMFACVWDEAAALRADGRLLAAFSSVANRICLIHGEVDPHPLRGVLEPLDGKIEHVVLLPRCGHTPWRERYAKDAFYQALQSELPTVWRKG